MDLFVRMGHGLPDVIGANMRAGFLRGLIDASTSGFAGKAARIDPCTAPEAYRLFVAITGCLGVSIDDAARALEEVVRRRDDFLAGVLDEQGSLRPVR